MPEIDITVSCIRIFEDYTVVSKQLDILLRQGDTVFAGDCLSVCLFACLPVNNLTQKIINGFQ